jgi:integrase
MGELLLPAIDKPLVCRIITQKAKDGYKPNRLKNMLTALQSCPSVAQEGGIINQNPTMQLGKRCVKKDPEAWFQSKDIFTEGEIRTRLKKAFYLGPRSYVTVVILARTGRRIGEVGALKLEDLHFRERVIHIQCTRGSRKKAPDLKQFNTPKSGKGRRIDMCRQFGEAMRAFIKQRRVQNDWLLPGQDSTPMRPRSWQLRLWNPLFEDGEVRRRNPHMLRHTYASLLTHMGESLLPRPPTGTPTASTIPLCASQEQAEKLSEFLNH